MIVGITGRPGEGKTLRLLWLLWQYVLAGRRVATNIELTSSCPFANRVARLDEPVTGEEEHILKCQHCSANKADPWYVCPPLWPVFKVIDHAHPGYFPCAWSRGEPTMWYRAFWHFLGKDWVVAVSEATDYWDSMEFASMPKVCRAYFPQHRKLGHILLLDFQNVDNLYNRVRRMMQLFIVCEHTARHHWLFRFFPLTWSRFVADSFSSERTSKDTHVESGFLSYSEAMTLFTWYRTDQIYGSFGSLFAAEQALEVAKSLPEVTDHDGVTGSTAERETGGVEQRNGGGSDATPPVDASQQVGVGGSGSARVVVRRSTRLPDGPGLFAWLAGQSAA